MPLVEELLSLLAEGPLSVLLAPTGEDDVTFLVKVSYANGAVCSAPLSTSDAPKLRASRKAYSSLLQRLENCGVISNGSKQLCDVGTFAVPNVRTCALMIR